jgi:ABC-type antimicrobial peptide transport system permease subunit
MAYLVGRRTREIGIRVALGAERGSVVGSVLREALGQVGFGLAAGLLGAFALTRLLRSQLFGLEPTDPATFSAVSALLVAVALLASWMPARRAAGVSPTVALREE